MAYTQNPHIPKVRWEAIKLVRDGLSTRNVAKKLGWSQSAVSQWVRRAGPGWYGPYPTKSSRPKRSPNALPRTTVEAIVKKRIATRRCGQVVHQELLRDGIVVSLPSVQRILTRCCLLKKRSPWKRPHDPTLRPGATHPGALLQCDTVHFILPNGERLYVYTIIDIFSRWAYAEVVERIGATASASFIRRTQRHAPFRFEMVQTDHGSEFSIRFTHTLWRMHMKHRHSRVRQSNDNAHVERFNRTVQEECLDRTVYTIAGFRGALKTYLPHYNTTRMHMGINYKTPSQMLGVSTRS